jgi:hypothetical protein
MAFSSFKKQYHTSINFKKQRQSTARELLNRDHKSIDLEFKKHYQPGAKELIDAELKPICLAFNNILKSLPVTVFERYKVLFELLINEGNDALQEMHVSPVITLEIVNVARGILARNLKDLIDIVQAYPILFKPIKVGEEVSLTSVKSAFFLAKMESVPVSDAKDSTIKLENQSSVVLV